MSDKKIMKTMDGNEACATVAYHFTDVAGIYPITPSSPMSEKVDEWSAAGKKNMFGQPVRLVEMQSEAGAAGALHGVAEAGALATTFTSSQGLLLMIPNLYIMAGHRMPAVFHVAARSVAQHANNIFGDHQDVMSCRTTGVTMMSTGSVQEVMDLAAVAHLTTIKTRVPFIHFHDGFRTSHEIQKIEVIDLDKVEKLLDRQALEDYHAIAMNPEHPGIVTALPPCFLTTSAGDYLRSYTLDFEKALSRYQVSHHLLDFSERKDLPHAFSVIDPFRKESIELLEDMSGYFQQFQ